MPANSSYGGWRRSRHHQRESLTAGLCSCPSPQCRLRVEEWNLTKVGNYFHEEYKKELQHAQAQQIYQEMLMAGGPQLRRSWSRGSGGAGRSDQLSIAQKGAFAASNLQQNLKLTTGMQKKMEVCDAACAGMKRIT